MKHYIIQTALNLDPMSNSFIPVKRMNWHTPSFYKGVIWTNYEDANLERLTLQLELNHYAVRVKRIGFFKYLKMRLNQNTVII